jgi:hypothetical protein
LPKLIRIIAENPEHHRKKIRTIGNRYATASFNLEPGSMDLKNAMVDRMGRAIHPAPTAP